MAHTPTLSELGALVLERRQQKRWGRRPAAQAGEISPVTWQKVEEGEEVQWKTYAGIEVALDWPRGSIRTYLDGGPAPEPVEPAQSLAVDQALRVASHESLLAEIARRHDELRAELSRRLYPALASADAVEDPDKLRADGKRVGRELGGEGTEDATGSGQS